MREENRSPRAQAAALEQGIQDFLEQTRPIQVKLDEQTRAAAAAAAAARQAAPFRRRESRKVPDDSKKRPGRPQGDPEFTAPSPTRSMTMPTCR